MTRVLHVSSMLVDIDDSEYCIDVVIQQLWYFVYQKPCFACGSTKETEYGCAGRRVPTRLTHNHQ